MSVYKTKASPGSPAGLTDAQLAAAAALVVEGRFDADLGGGVYKQRVARAGGGKSGGFRTLLAFRAVDRANVTAKELEALQAFAALLLGYGARELDEAVAYGELVELEPQTDADQDPQA